jgi:hypothetical protein
MSILDKLQKLDLTVFNKQKAELKSDLLNSLKEIAANERKNLNTISNVLDNMLIDMVDIFNTGYKKLLKSGIINNIEKKYLK